MLTYTALTTLPGKSQAEALGEALEELEPAPTGVGVFEVEDGKGIWEVGGYFLDQPNDIDLALLSAAFGAGTFVVSKCRIKIGLPKCAANCHQWRRDDFLFTADMMQRCCPRGALGC